ncbi:MAG: hypothetical protein CM15mP84_00410 [Cellvibrionales bacterium]|nr:MAG: hypothetical protein CM15mP84_00410 [Cellvibrionales bacterium]
MLAPVNYGTRRPLRRHRPASLGALLQALSAAAAYRREVGPIVEKDAALNFIFLSAPFPRSIKYFVRETRKELMRLSNHDLPFAPTNAFVDA